MIQRIQTVYLLIVVGLLITAMCLPMGYFIDAMGEHPFKALGLEVNGAIQSPEIEIPANSFRVSGDFF